MHQSEPTPVKSTETGLGSALRKKYNCHPEHYQSDNYQHNQSAMATFLGKRSCVPKVSCVLRSRPMRERRSSANEICRARTHTSASSLQFWCQDQPRFLKCIFPEPQACCSQFWCQEYWPTGWQELRKRRLTKSLDLDENFKPYLVKTR